MTDVKLRLPNGEEVAGELKYVQTGSVHGGRQRVRVTIEVDQPYTLMPELAILQAATSVPTAKRSGK